jgi:micrococcal nuclease
MYEYRVKKLMNVIDGDTIDVDIDLGFDISLARRVRMAGIDTPESRTTDKAEKVLGLESKEYLKKMMKDAKTIVIKTQLPDSSEKYGRILGWVYIDGATKSINEQMIEDGYAWGYMGETKVKDFEALAKIRSKKTKLV